MPPELATGIILVSLVAWAVRLEAKATQSTKDVVLLRQEFDSHKLNSTIHHNDLFFQEFEKRIDERFIHLSDTVGKVERYVEDIDKKIERYLSEH
jgi:hypothetical protein